MLTKLRIKLHSKLDQDIILSSCRQKLWSYVEIKKNRKRPKTIEKDKNDENIPQLEFTQLVLVHCSLNNIYQCNSKVLHTFIPNKSFVQRALLDSYEKVIFNLQLITFNLRFLMHWSMSPCCSKSSIIKDRKQNKLNFNP